MNLQDHHSLTHSFKVHDIVKYTLLGIGKNAFLENYMHSIP